jgi:TonB-dependent starch-binding outer membrane protein SusC
MKVNCKKLLFVLFLLPFSILAQNKLSGVVTDNNLKQPLPGVNVKIKGGLNSTTTNFDGGFTLTNLKKGDVIDFSYIGFTSYSVVYNNQQTLNVILQEESAILDQVVVVGYGSVKKKDATGAVDLITAKDFNKGSIISADQLLIGKSPGVRITTAGGAPDSAPNIRIRGGSSLSAENNPLIVIDGVPLDNKNAAGNGNPLGLINPNDIESFSILKDASASAIYGSRASNGVIIITTKKGTSGAPEFNFSSNVAIGSLQKRVNVRNSQEFIDLVKSLGNQNYVNSLGIDDPTVNDNPATPNIDESKDNPATPQIEGRIISNTDWQDVIYRESVSVDNYFSVRANLFNKLPFRASLGHTNNQGIVKTNDFERFTGSLKLNPSLLDNHLIIDLNAKGLISEKNAVDADGAFGNALNFDPTKPIYGDSPNNLGSGYYQDFRLENGVYILNGPTNPLAILLQRSRPEKIKKLLGNIEFNYKLHFFPDLRAVLNLGIETSKSNIQEIYSNKALQSYRSTKTTSVFNPGLNFEENQTVNNKLMDAYLVYSKDLKGFISKFDVQGGYSYQNLLREGTKREFITNDATGLREETFKADRIYYNPLVLQSFFGRSNIDFANKYLFTFSYRADGSSLFSKENRWGFFPGAAFAWKISEEEIFKNVTFLSNLKLRLGWGKTGQQDITGTAGYFPYTPFFTPGSNTSQYLPGVNIYNALPFNPLLTWEKTTTYNLGLDFDLFKSKIISGSFDIFKKTATDLLVEAQLPPGQGLRNVFTSNIGKTESKGFETSATIKVVENKNLNIDLNGNVAFNYVEITNLGDITSFQDKDSTIPNGTGTKIAQNTVNFQPYSAYVFQQIYNANGNPIEGAFVDRNKDGSITESDKYLKAIRPNWTFGFGLSANYKNFDFTSSFRGQKGGLVYDSRTLIQGNKNHVAPTTGGGNILSNVLAGDLVFDNNIGNVPLSDFFFKDASFIRCESATFGYKVPNTIKNGSLRFYVAANNLFLITKYKGQDPENFNGIDNNFYPRPRVYSFGVNLNF